MEIFTFPKRYSQYPLASNFSEQKCCKFSDMAAFAKSKFEITMSKTEIEVPVHVIGLHFLKITVYKHLCC